MIRRLVVVTTTGSTNYTTGALPVNDGGLGDGRDAVERLATQQDGIAGSRVGQNPQDRGCHPRPLAVAHQVQAFDCLIKAGPSW